MGLFGKIFGGKKKSKVKVDKHYDLKHLALRKISTLGKKRFSKEIFDEFIFIFRTYIKKIANVKKEYTHEELVVQLNNKKTNKKLNTAIINLSSEINDFEYAGEDIDKQKLKNLIEEFKILIKII